ncbi:hypothetical protein Bca101_005613 [Brassica carinata]
MSRPRLGRKQEVSVRSYDRTGSKGENNRTSTSGWVDSEASPFTFRSGSSGKAPASSTSLTPPRSNPRYTLETPGEVTSEVPMCIEAMVISYHRLDRGSVFYSAVSRLHQSSFFSSSYHEITTFSALMSAAKDISRGLSCENFGYQYIREVICTQGESAFKISPRVLLPEISYHKYCNMGCDGFVGYDPVEDQVFTLLGGPKKQQLRSLDIQGTWNLS